MRGLRHSKLGRKIEEQGGLKPRYQIVAYSPLAVFMALIYTSDPGSSAYLAGIILFSLYLFPLIYYYLLSMEYCMEKYVVPYFDRLQKMVRYGDKIALGQFVMIGFVLVAALILAVAILYAAYSGDLVVFLTGVINF